MFDIELNSFIVKFHQLRSAGRYAHLDLHCEGGQSFVSLRVQLGEAGQQPHHRHHQQVRRGLRRSPAYHRRQVRRRAARQAAASVPGAPAAEAEVQDEEVLGATAGEAAAHDEEIQTEEVSHPDVVAKKSSLIDDPDVRKHPRDWPAPKWWCDILDTYKPGLKLHGNVKFLISKKLQNSMNYSDDVISHTKFVRLLWTKMRSHPMNRTHFDPAGTALTDIFGTEIVKWSSLRASLAPHVFLNSSRIGVFSGKKLDS